MYIKTIFNNKTYISADNNREFLFDLENNICITLEMFYIPTLSETEWFHQICADIGETKNIGTKNIQLIIDDEKWNKIIHNGTIIIQQKLDCKSEYKSDCKSERKSDCKSERKSENLKYTKTRIIDEYFFGDKISHIVNYDYLLKKWTSVDIGTEYIIRKNTKTTSNILPDDTQQILEKRRHDHQYVPSI